MTKNCFAFIPARYASTRFPGKPLALISGRPMFWHVYTQAASCPFFESVMLATDDDRIARAAKDFNVPFIMTGSHHESGTDRIFEAANSLGLPRDAIIVNVQGDEPALDANILSQLVRPFFEDASVQVSTLAHKISAEEAQSENKVKVAIATNGDALYFSRAPIPFTRSDKRFALPDNFLGHIGLYAYRLSALARFNSLPAGELEQREGLEQLRFLENGLSIRVAICEYAGQAVDEPEDIAKVEKLLQNIR